MKGLATLIAVGAATLLICYSISSMAASTLKRDAHELLKPLNPPRGVIDAHLGFAEKMVGLAFALLALALIMSFLVLCLEVRARG